MRSHPSIITTCKQVHNEVDGLWNDLAGAEVSLSVRSGDRDVIFELCFKGVLLWRVSHKTPINIEEHAIRWPSLLQKVARVTVRLVLDLGIFPASAMKGFQAGKAVNYALQSLQLLLSDDANTDALCVEVSWASKTRDTGLRSIVAPLYALAGRFPTPTLTFINVSEATKTNIEAFTIGMRRLYSLEEEVKLAIKVIDTTGLDIGRTLGFYERPAGGVTFVSLFEFVDPDILDYYIERIEADLQAVANRNREGLSDSMIMDLDRLKQLQMARQLR